MLSRSCHKHHDSLGMATCLTYWLACRTQPQSAIFTVEGMEPYQVYNTSSAPLYPHAVHHIAIPLHLHETKSLLQNSANPSSNMLELAAGLAKLAAVAKAKLATTSASHVASSMASSHAQGQAANYLASHVTQSTAQHMAQTAANNGVQSAVAANSSGVSAGSVAQGAWSAGMGGVAAVGIAAANEEGRENGNWGTGTRARERVR